MRALLVGLVLLAGCGPIRPDPSVGRHFTIEHGTARFHDAMAGAREHCAALGMRARHLGSDRAYMMLSRFECTP